MAGSPRVQLSLKGRLLSEVNFTGPQLKIGRMRENDVVVNNLAVSRFHATLRREGDGFVLEDLGSENGTQLNGERISGTVAMQPGDVIQLGKYELRIVLQPGLQIAGPPKPKANDVWDSSQTFLAMPPAAKGNAPARAAESDLEPEAPALHVAPDPEGVFAFGEDDLSADAVERLKEPALAIEAIPLPQTNLEHTSLFDFGGPATQELAAPEFSPAAAAAFVSVPDEKEPASKLYAGLIVQRDGKLHLLRPWEDGDLCAGRAPECEIVLADAGVSRRHAVFVLTPDGHAVRDLESVNGIYVNGQRTKQHTLEVGDVVRIESFELTFVLDHQPIGSEVSGPTPAAPGPQVHGHATQFSLEAPALESEDAFELTPLAAEPTDLPPARNDAPFEANTDGFEILPAADDPIAEPPRFAPESHEAALPEADLISAEAGEDDEEKESTAQSASGLRPLAPAPPPRAAAIALRLSFDSGALSSARAREALAVLVEEGVELSARVSFERSDAD